MTLLPRWQQLSARPVRALQAGTPRDTLPEVVVVPGLGALGYLLPLVRACSAWTRVSLLDVPGFGHRATAACPADLAVTASTVTEWLESARERPVLLVGHSTGAQAALRAAVAVPDRVALLCLGGPTFPPQARRWWPLLARVARTLPHEPPALVGATLPEYLRGRLGVLALLRTALADEPERLVGDLVRPLLVVRGQHDAVSPSPWGAELAGGAFTGRAVTVPGAHNFPFTAPAVTSAVLRGAVGG